MPDASDAPLVWHKVAELDELPEGRVKTVVAGRKSLALTHYAGAYGALDNHCPHQGGPLGEGSIENGLPALPVARLRLLAAHRHAAARVHRRAGVLPGGGPRRRDLRRAPARAGSTRAPSPT